MKAYKILILFILLHFYGLLEAQDNIKVKNIYTGVNTGSYAPFYDNNSRILYWTEKQISSSSDTVDVQFFSQIGDTLDFGQIKNKQELEILGIPFNYISIGNVKLSRDKQKMVFATVSILEDTIWTIATANRNQENWEYEAVVFRSDFWSGHPAFVKGHDEIIFASVMTNEITQCYGKSDLFITRKSSESWQEPKNLGGLVNTEADELSPYVYNYQGRNTLYFSSDNSDGSGGLDIYKADINIAAEISSSYEPVRNINSEFDDAFFVVPHDTARSQIYFWASNKGGSRWALFGDWPKPKIIKPTFYARGLVKNMRTNELLPNAEIVIREIRHPDDTRVTLVEKILKDTSGKYEIVDLGDGREFEVISHSEDIFYESFKIKMKDGDTSMVIKPDSLARFVVELDKDREFEVTAQSGDLFYDAFTIEIRKDDPVEIKEFFFNVTEKLTLRINFPTNQYDNPYEFTLDSTGKATGLTWVRIMEILAANIALTKDKIQSLLLVGHTDDIGSPEANLILAQNRVDFIISELLKRGVSEEMLTGRAAGEAEPLKRKRNESLKDFRRRLRRVELQKVRKTEDKNKNE